MSASVTLKVKGLGHIPAIKNSMYSIVDKKNREWKKRCVRSFVYQLLSISPTFGHVIQTQQFLQSLIASLPQDDSWKDIPNLDVTSIKVPKGEEGAEIIITRL